MFTKIMIPVDLAHFDRLERSLACAGDLARLYDAEVVMVGVTSALPGKLAHNPKEFGEKLEALAAREGQARGVRASAHVIVAHDPSTDVDDALLKAVKDTGADLVVMASHLPNLADYVWPSNGGKIAAHAAASVLVVRG